MQLKCIAIDDEPYALALLKEYAGRMPRLLLSRVFDDAVYALEFLKLNSVDLIFLDINMPDITGLELVNQLPNPPLIIFTTAYKKFAFEGFELDAVDYLLKPFSFERFEKAAEKAFARYQSKLSSITDAADSLFVRSEYQLVKIDLNEIEYIESVQDYLKIHRTNGRPVMTLMTLKSILEKLPADRFKRIHRSYVIPLAKIKSIINRKVKLNTIELPISDSYADFLSGWK